MKDESKNLADFAIEVCEWKLLICGKEYNAWTYDSYIFDAIIMAKKWKPEQVTYDRIVHLRYWLRENIQHGHDLPWESIRSMGGTKKFIDDLIEREYSGSDWEEEKDFALKNNREVFQAQTVKSTN